MDDRVAALLDREAIRDVAHAYAGAVDRKDLAGVAACFTPDCAYEGSLGRGTITDALATLAGAFQRYASTMHVIGTQRVTLDGERARTETCCVAYHVRTDGSRFTTGVRYEDELVRTADGWRIAARRVRTEWTEPGDAAPPAGRRA